MKTEYRTIETVRPGDLVWRYHLCNLTGPYIVTHMNSSISFVVRMISPETGEIECLRSELRRAHVFEK